MNIIVTGRPGIGKTTVIRRVATLLGDRAAGFFTREIREGGRRTGFSIETLDGEWCLLATMHQKGEPRVGPYRVVLSNINSVAVPAVMRALTGSQVMLVDEIGKMELMSRAFRDIIMQALDSDGPLVATLSVSKDRFSERIRSRPDVSVLEVSHANREGMAGRIISLIEAWP